MQLNPLPSNPFVGLRPYETTESELFFGRSAQTGELLERLSQNRFVSVVGRSGCGKSSLIRAGLIPILKAGFLIADRDRWTVATMKPGDYPLRSFASTILEWGGSPVTPQLVAEFVEEITAGGVSVLMERIAPVIEKLDANFLLLVDQFEEIFRFGLRKRDLDDTPDSSVLKTRDQAADFVSMILALSEQRELPVYVVMTMRSDFLGDCDSFSGLPEAMNRSQYLVPRLTTQQREEAISGPIRLVGESITRGLLDLVRNDVGDKMDQLPVMQHAMMRTWGVWSSHNRRPVDVVDYEAAGTIKNALSEDAEAVLNSLDQRQQDLAKRIFQALTETDSERRRVRRPARLQSLETITGAGADEIMDVVQRFQSGDRDFLTVSRDNVEGNHVIDISHESLIRQWKTLRNWVDQEDEDRSTYLRIAEDAVRYKLTSGVEEGLWVDPSLQVALDWWDKRKPTPAWAAQYHARIKERTPIEFDIYNETRNFLDESKRARERGKEEKERQRKQRENLTRLLMLAIIAGSLASVGFGAYAMRQKSVAEAQTKVAEAQTRIAKEQKAEADRQTIEAKNQKLIADSKTNEAQNQAGIAKTAAENALKAQKDAEIARGEAQKQARIADDNARKAISQEQRAKASEEQIRLESYRINMYSGFVEERQGHASLSRKLVEDYLSPDFDRYGTDKKKRSDDNKQNLRGYEWYYLWHLTHRDDHVLPTKAGAAQSVAFSNNGDLVAAACSNGVKLWNPVTEAEVTGLDEIKSAVTIAFSQPPSELLAIARDDGKVTLRNVEGGETTTFDTQDGSIKLVGFSTGKSRLVTVAENNNIRLWDTQKLLQNADATAELLPQLNPGNVRLVAFSSARNRIALVRSDAEDPSGYTSRIIEIWDIDRLSKLAPIKADEELSDIAFDSAGDVLGAATTKGAIVFWGLPSASRMSSLQAHEREAVKFVLSPSGEVATWKGNEVKIWTFQSDKPRLTFNVDPGPVKSVVFSPDGRTIATGDEAGTVRIWDLSLIRNYTELVGGGGAIPFVTSSRDGKTFATRNANGTISVFSWPPKPQSLTLRAPQVDGAFTSVALSPDGQIVASGDKLGDIRLYNIGDTSNPKLIQASPSLEITNLIFISESTLVACNSANELAYIDLISGKRSVVRSSAYTPYGGISNSLFSSDGQSMITFDGANIITLDLKSRQEIGRVPFTGSISPADVYGKLVAFAGFQNNNVEIWDASKGKQIATLPGEEQVLSVAFSSDGRTIATGSVDKSVTLWNVATGKQLAALGEHKGVVFSVKFVGDRTLLSSSRDGTVRVWRGADDSSVLTQLRARNAVP